MTNKYIWHLLDFNINTATCRSVQTHSMLITCALLRVSPHIKSKQIFRASRDMRYIISLRTLPTARKLYIFPCRIIYITRVLARARDVYCLYRASTLSAPGRLSRKMYILYIIYYMCDVRPDSRHVNPYRISFLAQSHVSKVT